MSSHQQPGLQGRVEATRSRRIGGCSLFDTSLADDLGPARDVPLYLCRELLRSFSDGCEANRREPFLDFRQLDDARNLAIELVDDVLRRASRHKHGLNKL